MIGQLVLVSTLVQAGSSAVVVDYDRFKDATTVKFDAVSVGDGLRLNAFYFLPGNKTTDPDDIVLTIISRGKDWRFLRSKCPLDLLVDSGRMSLAGSHDGRVGSGYVIEFCNYVVKPEDFKKLASASVIEGRLFNTEFTFGSGLMRMFRSLGGHAWPKWAAELPGPANLGVKYKNRNDADVSRFGLPSLPSSGAIIVGVKAGSQAEQAGLRVGDMVTALEGAPIESAKGLYEALRKVPQKYVVTFIRGAVERELTISRLKNASSTD